MSTLQQHYFLQNFDEFRTKLEPFSKLFHKSLSQSILILAIVTHPHFLIIALQIKTIIV